MSEPENQNEEKIRIEGELEKIHENEEKYFFLILPKSGVGAWLQLWTVLTLCYSIHQPFWSFPLKIVTQWEIASVNCGKKKHKQTNCILLFDTTIIPINSFRSMLPLCNTKLQRIKDPYVAIYEELILQTRLYGKEVPWL